MVEVHLEGHAAELAALAAFLGQAGQLAVQRVQLASQLSVQVVVIHLVVVVISISII